MLFVLSCFSILLASVLKKIYIFGILYALLVVGGVASPGVYIFLSPPGINTIQQIVTAVSKQAIYNRPFDIVTVTVHTRGRIQEHADEDLNSNNSL